MEDKNEIGEDDYSDAERIDAERIDAEPTTWTIECNSEKQRIEEAHVRVCYINDAIVCMFFVLRGE